MMRHFLWMLFFQGFWCYENPLRINPNSLEAWTGSCVLFPCQIDERINSRKIVATSVVWYFQPVLNMTVFDYVGSVLYNNSRFPNEHTYLPSPDFQGRVRFVGDLTNGNCNLMITQLQKKDNGTYVIKVTATVENQLNPQILHTSATLKVSELFPIPKLEILKCQERWALQVACSVPMHCPEESIRMNFKGLEKYLTAEIMMTDNGILRKIATIQPIARPRRKAITCQLSNKDMSQKSSITQELDMKNCPNDVQVFVVNNLPIKEGDIVTLNCSVGSNSSSTIWFNWWMSDLHVANYKYSSSQLLTFPARFGPVASYKCEACNTYGCTSSPLLTADIFFAPRKVRIQKDPRGQIDEGMNVVLHCDVGEANPTNLSYTWYKDGEMILWNSPHAHLNLTNIDPAQSGRYWCEASNSMGKTPSPSIALHIICFHCDENPISIVPKILSAWEKSCVVIPCHINQMLSSGTVNVTGIVWNFKPLGKHTWSEGETILLYNSSQTSGTITTVSEDALPSRTWFIGNLTNRDCSLLISPVRTLDSGIYKVKTTVSVDKYPWQFKRSLSASLNVTGKKCSVSYGFGFYLVAVAPRKVRIQKDPRGQIDEGMNVVLHCDVGEANPTNLSYTWYKDGEMILWNSPHAHLNLTNIDPAQSGRYWCEASNSMGKTPSPSIALHIICELKLTMRCFLWLLFLPGSLGDPLSVIPQTLRAWEGSCVIISCKIEEEHESRHIHQVSFAWYFNPSFDNGIGDYTGTLLYNSNQTVAEVSSEFRNRVTFVGDLGRKNCSLKISQLHQSDTGTYGIRLYWKAGNLPEQQKWFFKVSIRVYETPLQLIDTWSPQMKEGSKYRVECSIPYHCFAEPIKLSIEGLEDHHEFSPEMTTETQRVKVEGFFTATSEDHEKQLTCLLKPHKGTEIRKKFANLMVKYGPKGVKLNADREGTLREGNKLTLECIVGSSNPAVDSFQWFKNGERWNNGQWGARREFYSLKDTDSGNYRCQVGNSIRSISSKDLNIDVQYLPKVSINGMPRLPIRENDKVVLKCSAIGNPAVNSYEWYKSSTSGIIMDGPELRFEGIQPSNSDTYHCMARNEIGHSNRSVTLNVNYRPKNVQLFPLNPLPVKEGDTVILNCTVGSSYPSINNYNFLKSTTFMSTSDHRYSALTFFAVPELSVPYSCQACNNLGCTSSPSILLDVLYGPKDLKLNREPSGLVLEGDPVRLTCSVGKANPKTLSYTWYKDGERLPLNSTESVLFIQNAQSMDSGRYHCVSKNIITNAMSPSIRLEVNYGPRNVHVTLDKKSVTEGMDVYLKCDNDAYPLVDTYKWYWKGEEIFMENSKILVLRKIKPEQSGEYLCKAFNSVSNKESQLLTISVSCEYFP
ncbi:PREDICTED: B-cell receptor CD22-like [Thamnophis sirtalis]|uniref:B-cell receptor CD22 n=1 Tax=Thamnophis sirtalis TaxID=35019 RepID=A0A6I9XYE2_9SAUR|nr:PREDICTED: B-cell receptor CD22-like [Thamnophis sirtalis]